MSVSKKERERYRDLRRDVLLQLNSVRLDHLISNPRLISDEPGVYIIFREDNGHPYVGESVNLSRRLIEHATVERPTQYVDREIQKLGAFRFWVAELEVVKNYDKRREREGYYVELFNSYYNGYNGSKDGGAMTLGQRYWRNVFNKLLKTLFPKLVKKRKERNKYLRSTRALRKYGRKLKKINRRSVW